MYQSVENFPVWAWRSQCFLWDGLIWLFYRVTPAQKQAAVLTTVTMTRDWDQEEKMPMGTHPRLMAKK